MASACSMPGSFPAMSPLVAGRWSPVAASAGSKFFETIRRGAVFFLGGEIRRVTPPDLDLDINTHAAN